jgi:hypothetical protein
MKIKLTDKQRLLIVLALIIAGMYFDQFFNNFK